MRDESGRAAVDSATPSESDGRAGSRGQLPGRIAVDDGDLDPSGAADQCDQGTRGTFSISVQDALDPLAGDLDDPAIGRPIGEPIGVDVGDQVAERVAKDHLADEPLVVGGRLEVPERDELGARRPQLVGRTAADQVGGGRGQDVAPVEGGRDELAAEARDW